jgi:hypothetical protein
MNGILKLASLLFVLLICAPQLFALDHYIGCFRDGVRPDTTTGRDLSGAMIRDNNMTPDLCIKTCSEKGFTYAGVQYSSYCYCGNEYGSFGKSDGCSMQCTGDKTKICGGSWANSLYTTKLQVDLTQDSSVNTNANLGEFSVAKMGDREKTADRLQVGTKDFNADALIVYGHARFYTNQHNYLAISGYHDDMSIDAKKVDSGLLSGSIQLNGYTGPHHFSLFRVSTRSVDNKGIIPIWDLNLTKEGKLGLGTNDPKHELSVNGTVQAKEVIVESNWSDYVFSENYELMPISELSAFIKQHKHLPGVPKENDVRKNGLNIGKTQTALLAKIEELTIYIIQQSTAMSQQQKLIDELYKKNKKLLTRLVQVEAMLTAHSTTGPMPTFGDD